MSLILHHCHDARSMRTYWLLAEMGLDFELVIHSFDRSLRDPEFLALSPAGRVPALVHNGRALTETGAITEYLCETFPTPLFRPPGDPERVEWLTWLHYAETIGQHLAILTQQHIVLREEDRSPGLMKLERRRLENALEVVAKAVAAQEYLLASGFSAVDTNIGYGLYVARWFTGLEAWPDLAAYYARLADRPAFEAALPPEDAARIYHQPFYDVPGTD